MQKYVIWNQDLTVLNTDKFQLFEKYQFTFFLTQIGFKLQVF